MPLSNGEYELTLIFCFSEIMCADISDKVKKYRFDAFNEVRQLIKYYEGLGYGDKLLNPIAEKKCEFIHQIITKADKDEVIKPHIPHYDGNRFVPDKYHIPEEELIGWSQTSLRGPLNSIGMKRYMELFKSIYPEHANQLTY